MGEGGEKVSEAESEKQRHLWPLIRANSPDAYRLETFLGTWILWLPWGDSPSRAVALLETSERIRDLAKRLCALYPEITGTFSPREATGSALAFRSLSSGFELFYLTNAEGRLVLTDFYRDAVSLLPPQERTLGLSGITDYLLTLCPIDECTYVPGISRVPNGALWEWGPCAAEPVRGVAETLVDLLEEEPCPSVEEALARAMEPLRGNPRMALLFSGGIDSSLLASFLDPGVEALVALAPPKELSPEHEIARRGTRILGMCRTREVSFTEDRFVEAMAETISRAGVPVPFPNYQGLFQENFFGTEHSAYCTGDMADSLFGYRDVETGQDQPDAWEEMRGTFFPEGGLIRELGTMGLFSGAPAAVRLLGEDTVAGRLRDRHAYLLKRTGDLSRLPLSFNIFAEWGHIAFVLGQPYWRHHYRQQAIAHGKSLLCPYAQRDALRAAWTMPTGSRAPAGAPLKIVLRKILKARIPDFPIELPKGGNGVPRTRYCTTGPLAGFFKDRPAPSTLPPEALPTLVNPSWETSGAILNLAVLALWEETCLRTDNPPKKPPRYIVP